MGLNGNGIIYSDDEDDDDDDDDYSSDGNHCLVMFVFQSGDIIGSLLGFNFFLRIE